MNEQKNYPFSCLPLFEQYRLAFELPVGKLRQRSNYSRISQQNYATSIGGRSRPVL